MGEVFKWVNPLYWPYGVARGLFYAPGWALEKVWQGLCAAWMSPKTTLGKWTLRPLYVFIAIPGSIPWALFHTGKFLGLEEEMTYMYDGALTVASGTGAILLDVLGKAAFAVVMFAAKATPLMLAAIAG